MQTRAVEMDREQARELYERYRNSVSFGTSIDKEIMRTYRLLSQGKVVIKAIESIRVAGLNEEGLPKLAIVRADATHCWWRSHANGSGCFAMRDWGASKHQKFDVPADTFPRHHNPPDAKAIVPIVPQHLRPTHGLRNYHILWEADWREVPKDPLLLRRLGEGDLWLVLAAWDLTEVERAALQARV